MTDIPYDVSLPPVNKTLNVVSVVREHHSAWLWNLSSISYETSHINFPYYTGWPSRGGLFGEAEKNNQKIHTSVSIWISVSVYVPARGTIYIIYNTKAAPFTTVISRLEEARPCVFQVGLRDHTFSRRVFIIFFRTAKYTETTRSSSCSPCITLLRVYARFGRCARVSVCVCVCALRERNDGLCGTFFVIFTTKVDPVS